MFRARRKRWKNGKMGGKRRVTVIATLDYGLYFPEFVSGASRLCNTLTTPFSPMVRSYPAVPLIFPPEHGDAKSLCDFLCRKGI
jgi:hypothetical protein